MISEQRVAIVTGGGQGIGKAIATRIAVDGAHVVINDIDEERARTVADELREMNLKADWVAGDVSISSVVEAMFRTVVAKFGRIDILVNNAGITRDRRIVNMTDEDWDTVLRVDLRSVFVCAREAARVMIGQRYGRIISLASRAWLGGFGQANYSAAKGGVVSISRALALELAKHAITVNCIAPGVIDTPLIRSYPADAIERLATLQPMGRFGSPDDVAHAVAFFASDEANYITGQTLYVCGGKSIGSYGT